MDLICLAISSVMLLIGVVLLLVGILRVRRLKSYSAGTIIPINTIQPGEVKIKGQVMPLKMVTSPLSRGQCVYYKLFQEANPNLISLIFRMTEKGQSEQEPFLIGDGTSQVLVEPAGSMVLADAKRYNLSGPMVSLFLGATYMYERAIRPFDWVVVRGLAVQNIQVGGQVDPLEHKTAFKIMKGNKEPFIISNFSDNKATGQFTFDVIFFFAFAGILFFFGGITFLLSLF